MDLAPKIADQAQKLIANARHDAAISSEQAHSTELAGVRLELVKLAADNADLRADLMQASELLAQLAHTNQHLVAKLNEWRPWFWGLAGASLASIILSVVALLA